MKVELSGVNRIKNHLVLKFSGVCGEGSSGNDDVDFIMENTKNEIQNTKNIQGVIFDFQNLRYLFGNRFVNLFLSSSYKVNKMLYIRMISNKHDLKRWRSLINDCTDLLSEKKIIAENVFLAIKSINSEMNEIN